MSIEFGEALLAALTPDEVDRIDRPHLAAYQALVEKSAGRARSEKSRLERLNSWSVRDDLGPIAVDGNAYTARVVHLKANPRFGANATRQTHYAPHPDWPLSVAGPHNVPGTVDYYQNTVFRHLLQEGVTLQQIGQRMLKVELCPWASDGWPTDNAALQKAMGMFPSRQKIFDLVRALTKRDVLFVIARADALWLAGVPELKPLIGSRVFLTQVQVAAWISRGAFPDGWRQIVTALKE